jgi:hypothetical protein
MAVVFDVREDEGGWTVFDRRTGKPAENAARTLVGLSRECAERMADCLNDPECEVWRNVSITGP